MQFFMFLKAISNRFHMIQIGQIQLFLQDSFRKVFMNNIPNILSKFIALIINLEGKIYVR